MSNSRAKGLNLNGLYRFSKKYPDIKLYEIPSSGSRVVPCGGTDGRTNVPTDMTMLKDVFRNFTKGPQNRCKQTFQWSFASGFQTKTYMTFSLLPCVLHPKKGTD